MKSVPVVKTQEVPKEVLRMFETLARWRKERDLSRRLTGSSRTVNLKIVRG